MRAEPPAFSVAAATYKKQKTAALEKLAHVRPSFQFAEHLCANLWCFTARAGQHQIPSDKKASI